MSKEVKRLVLNYQSYFCESSTTHTAQKKQKNAKVKAKTLYILLRTIEKVVEQGKLMKNERRKNQRKQNRFSKIYGVFFGKT